MRTITLHIPDDIYFELRAGMGCRMLACASYGLLDAFMGALLNRLEKGETEWTVVKKEKN